VVERRLFACGVVMAWMASRDNVEIETDVNLELTTAEQGRTLSRVWQPEVSPRRAHWNCHGSWAFEHVSAEEDKMLKLEEEL